MDLGGVTYYDINCDAKNGFPLKIAAAKGSEKFVRLMLENRMLDIQKKDAEGLNAFWVACRYGHGKVMRVLAEAGIDVNIVDKKEGLNVLHLACKYKFKNIVEMLVKSNFTLDE